MKRTYFFMFALLCCLQSISQTQTSSKKFYVFGGLLLCHSRPYKPSSGSAIGALSGINSGVQIGFGIVNQISDKWQLNTALSVNSISPFFYFHLPLENFSYASAFGTPRERNPARLSASAINVQTTISKQLKGKTASYILGMGIGANYMFTKSANSEITYVFLRQDTRAGETKECAYTQKIDRISIDIPISFAIENIKNLKRCRLGLQYNLAIIPRSTGSYRFDMDQGVTTGSYKFIGSTAGITFGYYLTR